MMLQASCTICSDLFEVESNVSATHCGHVFHEHCLQRWLNQSKTCPQCRADCFARNVVKRLYFNQSEEEAVTELDASSLKNELDRTKALLSQRNREKSAFKKTKDALSEEITKLTSQIGDLIDRVNKEEITNSALKKQLQLLCNKQDEAERARREAKELRIKLQRLERFEAVMNETCQEVDDMLHNYGTGPHAVRDLTVYCCSLKKEFDNSKQLRRTMRDELEQTKRCLQVKNKALIEKTEEVSSLQRQLALAEEDVAHSENENKGLRKKISILERAVESPSGTAGAISRLIMESPAPQHLKKPRLSGSHDSGDIEFNLIPGNPDTPEIVKESPSIKMKSECEEFGVNYVKTTSLAKENMAQKQAAADKALMCNMYRNSSLFKKRPLLDSKESESKIRRGYNGFGGHHTFIETTEFSAPSSRKIVRTTKKKMVTKPKGSSMRTLDSFVS
ncbi:E3 ubiquitin-protein ligase TRAIP-like [Saccoglossus kowalevskii]|uniref:TRAF-interacting protein-like n=1 Tax=Saccoglossus kowalevskii TaxID=10224 RepID=A0ABM0MJ77_SACKO|nr:PREDICTED: TRAF-interacting protein-like [Saccoglossus kowalevskii]